MAKKKMKDKNTSNPLLWITLVVVIVGLALYLFPRGIQEKKQILELKSAILSLKGEFENITPNWKYSELCFSEGGKSDPDKPSSCNISLSKSAAKDLDIKTLSNLIQENTHFSLVNGVSTFDASLDENPNLFESQIFRSVYFDDEVENCEVTKELKSNDIYLHCSISGVTQYHFKRVRP